jgi:hypothetical protein
MAFGNGSQYTCHRTSDLLFAPLMILRASWLHFIITLLFFVTCNIKDARFLCGGIPSFINPFEANQRIWKTLTPT